MSEPARICNVPGCGNPTVSGKCTNCRTKAKRESDRRNGRPHGRTWRRLRGVILKRDPLCQDKRVCKGLSSSVDVDHIIPLVEGGHPTALSNLQGICRDCHKEKTQEEHRRLGNHWQGLKEDL